MSKWHSSWILSSTWTCALLKQTSKHPISKKPTRIAPFKLASRCLRTEPASTIRRAFAGSGTTSVIRTTASPNGNPSSVSDGLNHGILARGRMRRWTRRPSFPVPLTDSPAVERHIPATFVTMLSKIMIPNSLLEWSAASVPRNSLSLMTNPALNAPVW